jgi:methylated-DNA-[protein]-cysteine S-methyltransferase
MNLFTFCYHSPIGLLKLQSTNEYLTAVLFMEEEGQNEKEQTTEILHWCREQLDEYFSGKRKHFDLPVSQDGTTFQKNVWNHLSKIPYGKTISYSDLSKQTGNVKAIRAVAAANGKNKVAIIIPCHRVIGSNEKLVGYAGGLWRKKWLLEHEARHHSGVQHFDF